MAAPTYEKTPVKKTTPTRKQSAKSSATKHGHGLDQSHVDGVTDREFREHKSSLRHSNKDLWLTVAVAVLATVISTYLTTRWYGL